MRFIVDAQLPRRLAIRLRELGHEAWHTLELPAGNRTTDRAIWELADAEGAIVVTKDADFVINRALHGQPARLLVVATGNIENDALLKLFELNLSVIETHCAGAAHVELGLEVVTVRQ